MFLKGHLECERLLATIECGAIATCMHTLLRLSVQDSYDFNILLFAQGFPCSEGENPADYFLDVLTLCEKKQAAGKNEVSTHTGR